MPIENKHHTQELTPRQARYFTCALAIILGLFLLGLIGTNPPSPSPDGFGTTVTESIQDIQMDSWLGNSKHFQRFTIDTDTRTIVVKNIHSPITQSNKDTVTYTVTDDGEVTDAKITLSPESVKTYSAQYADTYEQTLTVKQPEKETTQ